MKQFFFTYTDLAASALAIYIIAATCFKHDSLIGTSDWLLWGSVVIIYMIIRCIGIRGKYMLFACIALSGFIQSLWGWGQYMGWVESNHIHFSVTGSFLNPGPFSGYVGACFLLLCGFITKSCQKRNRLFNLFLLPVALSMLGILVVAFSRAAWLASLIALCWLIIRVHKRRTSFLLYSVLFLFACSIGLYHLKRESADARLFIWKVGSDLFCQSPIVGQGSGSFASGYMYLQAEYFEGHPESSYALKAADNTHAFNEYLRIACEYGMIGLVLFVLPFIVSIRQDHTQEASCFLNPTLLYLGVFSLFSYSLQVTPLVLLLTCIVAAYSSKPLFVYSRWILYLLILILLCIGVYVAHHNWRKSTQIERLLHQYEHSASPAIAEELFGYYLQSKNDREYVAACAMLFYKNGLYTKAEVVLKQASTLFPSSRILYDLGNCYYALHQYEEAEQALLTSSHMVPSHILPQYYLFRYYAETGQQSKAIECGRQILYRSFKQEGSVAIRVKGLVGKYLTNKEGGDWQ